MDTTISNDDSAARKRKEIAEKLRLGSQVKVTPQGELVDPNDPKVDGVHAIELRRGKMAASFYWYERNKALLEADKQAMRAFFPGFRLDKLDDGRLYWIGQVNPRGKDGGVWTLQAVYQHNHPSNDSYGGSVRVYSIDPDMDELYKEAGKLPHILRDETGHLYMCTARKEDVAAGANQKTSAATSIGWAVRWIWAVESWLAGELGNEIFEHTY